MYVRKYCDGKRIDLQILTDLHVFSIPEYGEVVLVMPSVCVCVYVDMPLPSD
jgi:hypothetical protein